MKLRKLILRNLAHFWRTNLAVVAGVATAVAVLSGALLVGQSVRASLRDLMFQRLGTTEYVVSADRFFREEVADSFQDAGGGDVSCPVIYLQGVLVLEGTGARALHVNVFGVDGRFWKFHGASSPQKPEDRSALIGEALARLLGAHPGDGLLLRLETQQGIPRESLYGRRENAGRTIRLTCGEILPAGKLGEFSLRPSQGTVYSMFVPLGRLQKDLAQPARANTILLRSGTEGSGVARISHRLDEAFDLEDAGIRLHPILSGRGFSVESARILLDDSVARAAFGAAAETGLKASGIFSYLANSIRSHGREIPYSVITAADLDQGALEAAGIKQAAAVNGKEAIWLNDWAARELGTGPDEPVEIDYYVWKEDGRLVTQTAQFHMAGVIAIGGDVDATLAPEFPGITEARSIKQWDPPFPIDLHRIRPQDEDYWDRYRAAPKAFIRLPEGQRLWQSRFGNLSSIRIAVPGGEDPIAVRRKLAQAIRNRIRPEQAGFSISSVRQQGLDASRGSTDFGEYFVYFSFFLIAAAILLAALFFRLGIEQRVREIGTLRSLGFSAHALRRIFLVEGLCLSLAGSLVGLPCAIAYSGLLVVGLRTWWIGAVGTRRLYLHVSWPDLGYGAAAGILVSLLVIAWTLRALGRSSPRALLTGVLESMPLRVRHSKALVILFLITFIIAGGLLLASAFEKVSGVAGFFGAGFLLLVALLCLAALYLRRNRPGLISGRGWRAQFRLGARNAMHRPGRSLLCIALIASATFIIVSMEAFRQDPAGISLQRKSGTGGYPLIAESALPIVYDPNSAAGREALGIPPGEAPELADVKFTSFRERPGDDVSCLNLYVPQEPKILGAPHSFVMGARFIFQASQPGTAAQNENPWLLLESALPDGAVPAIGDANTIQYILHLGIGQDLTVRGDNGQAVRLRLVAALQGSVLQGELVISEANFLRAFPRREGYSFFLLDAPHENAAALVQPLMERMADWGFSVEQTAERLAAYHRVENTYLSTFQALGALGLVLGTAGLATVLLRNVLERRQELALLRAVGYRRRVLSVIILAENAVLIVLGLACGSVCALLAIAPALSARGGAFPIAMTGAILAAVLIVGLTASTLATIAAFRSPLLAALRSE